MKSKQRRLLYLTALAIVVVFTMITTTYLIQSIETKKCHTVFENGHSKLAREAAQIELLEVPEEIEAAVKPNEWLSRGITDSERECSPLLNSKLESTRLDGSVGCQIPTIDPFHPSMMNLVKGDVPMPKCSQFKSYGKLVNGKIRFLSRRWEIKGSFNEIA